MRRVMLIALIVVVAIAVVYLLIPSASFNLFKSELTQELARHPPTDRGVFTEQDIASLPDPVRRYFRVCGWLGKPKPTNGALDIEQMQLKLDLDKDFFPVTCYQFNSVIEPTRIVYLNAKMFGVIPFDGRDKFWNGEGNMFIRLFKVFTVQNVTGPEMDKSALVTVLAETFLVPTYALQPYMTWSSIDSNTAKATISHQGVNVSGTFHFNDAGEAISFETNDRFMANRNGNNVNAKWYAFMNRYEERGGIRIPTDVSAAWEINSEKKEYVRLKIKRIGYDVSSVEQATKK